MSVQDYRFGIRVNGVDVGQSRHLLQWTDVNTYYHTKNGWLASNVVVIPFCLDTSSYQPTGTLNFSRLDKFEIMTTSAVPMTTLCTGPYMYAVGYNILEVSKGSASLLYWD